MIDVYGTAGPIEDVSFAGKTDPQIAHELLAGAGFARDRVDHGLADLWRLYIKNLRAALLDAPVFVYPGVDSCLEMLEGRSDDAVLGLLTGNIEAGARCKLEGGGIAFERFLLGAFGSDDEIRNHLPAVAAQRAEALLGRRYRGEEMVVIGDTPADVECGDAFGARTIAVATGGYSRGELQACNPDYLFDTLEDTAAVWQAIGA